MSWVVTYFSANQNDAYLVDTSNLHKPCVSLSPSTMDAAYSTNKDAQNSMIDRMKVSKTDLRVFESDLKIYGGRSHDHPDLKVLPGSDQQK